MEDDGLVVASCNDRCAAVVVEEGMGEGEVAFADQEDAVGGGERDFWGEGRGSGAWFRGVSGLAGFWQGRFGVWLEVRRF